MRHFALLAAASVMIAAPASAQDLGWGKGMLSFVHDEAPAAMKIRQASTPEAVGYPTDDDPTYVLAPDSREVRCEQANYDLAQQTDFMLRLSAQRQAINQTRSQLRRDANRAIDSLHLNELSLTNDSLVTYTNQMIASLVDQKRRLGC